MTPWWPPANRSPPGCWRSRCRRIGIQARSWQGWQIPIRTSDAHASARILEIDGSEIINRFKDRKEVAVIAGFQGINPQTGRITTLGRGGSDTSAVAIAAAIHADRCDIYTDVDGVYTTDPRVVPKARRLDKIAFEDMLELASQGAKVLQVRSVELGMVHNMPIFVRSSFDKPEDIDPHANAAGHADLQRGGNHGKPRRHRHRLFQGRSPDFRPPDRGQAGRRRRDLRPAGGGQYQRRHDRAERLGGRQDHRPHLHGAGLGLRPRQATPSPRPRTRSAMRGSTAPPTSPRSR